MLKKSKQQEMLQKLHEVDIERRQHLVDRFREFQELLQASESEMTDSEANRAVERDQALYDAAYSYAAAPGGDASEALDKELEEMTKFVEYYIETEDD